ncbi:SMC family ATPase [Nocardiopsis sp. CNT-189]|uniref:AAA family ATPase n=1 Tax=Nocardiopsis oceanisediminis TaxID=2816862 RepID=UPI003B29E626
MRLHSLTVQAFGPFAGAEEVDFDRLGAAGLFLVHGPTGAGKTSVLDAVCFALYGGVPGVRGAARSLQSTHAPPSLRPEAALEFTVRGRRLRITRSPAWRRPKKRGSGTTEEKAKVTVAEYTGGTWRPITLRPDEAGQFVSDLLGVNLKQFCQVVLLPQGEFARFLRAPARERRDSLEQIFGTGVFTDVEKWLAEHSAALGRAAGSAEASVLNTARLLAEAARSPLPEAAEEDPDSLVPWAAELASATAADARDAAPITAGAVAARDRARTALEQGRSVLERRRRRAAAAAREAELAARAAERAAWDAELAAAERAAPVAPLLRAAENRRVELEKAELAAAERTSLAGGLAGAPEPRPAAEPAGSVPASDADRLRTAERGRRDEIARLKHLLDDAERLTALRGEVRGLDGRAAGARRDRERLAARTAELPGRRAELAAGLEELRARTGPREAAVEALEAARRRHRAAADTERLSAELAEAVRRRTAAVDAAQAARDALLDLRRLRIEGMAAELAAELGSGSPCPVCGSVEHPAPAEGGPSRPSPEDEERAQARSDAADSGRAEAERLESSLTERLAAARELAGGLDAQGAEERVRTRRAALDELEAAAAQAARTAERIAALDAELERVRAEEARLDRELAELTERRAARGAEAERIAARLDAARGDDPDLPARVARLEEEAGLLHAAAEALDRRTAAAGELHDAEAEARRAREEAGFPDAAAVRAAERTEAERRAVRERARGHDDELAAVRAVLADPATAEAWAAPEPDAAALRAALEAAEAAADHAVSWRDRLQRRARDLADLRAELDRRLTGSRPARERHRVADGLARLAAGTSPANRESVPLSSYVLAARLELVVAAANDRLATMSGRRYELRHTVDKAAGDRTRSGGGLGLRVIDAWTGQERDPATLSGGETFIASLALALGLADVAGEESGGTDIGTLFIDEGFGTLDEETLEEVLDVLDRLRDGGRAVGVVSHVADLRSRIPAKLRVLKSPSGSRLEQTG